MLLEIMVPEIARITKEQLVKRVATSMLVGAAFDGLMGVIQEKNPAKEGAKGAIVGGVGQGASIAVREAFHTSEKVGMTVGVLASVATRYALNYVENKNKPTEDQDGEVSE